MIPGTASIDSPTIRSVDARPTSFCATRLRRRPPLATSFPRAALRRPLFLEGEPGIGKTEIAKALARRSSARCSGCSATRGSTSHGAAYEWNYARQMIEIRLAEAGGDSGERLAGATLHASAS